MRIIGVLLAFWVCSVQSESLTSYITSRNDLIEEEYRESLAGKVTLNSYEQQADIIFNKMMQYELQVMGDNFPPAINFFTSKGFIDNSSVIFPLLQRMPKGAVQHVHFDSSGSYGWLVSNATYNPYCYMYTGQTTKVGNDTLFQGSLQFFTSPPSSEWVSVPKLRATSGDNSAFDAALLKNLTLEGRDVGDYYQLWTSFDRVFGLVAGVLNYVEVAWGYFEHVFTEMLMDGVLRLEMRASPSFAMYDLEGNTYNEYYFLDMVQTLVTQAQKINPSFSVGLIMAVGRHQPKEVIFNAMNTSLHLINQYPDLIMGFDIDGPEDEGYPLLYFIDQFLAIQNMSANFKYGLPFYFHAGETILSNNTNLYDAVLLKSVRIGHGLQLAKHPVLMDIVSSTPVAIEVCPISNQILHFFDDMRTHPAMEYFQRGFPISVNPDDPAIYGYGGVSYDYYYATLGWTLDIAGLKQLCLNSLTYSTFPNSTIEMQTFNEWNLLWNDWIQNIIKG
eukprot:TRINITY_DN2881_c0_g1_i1.p1 TRINITY_DN2881_c0_g1~~TRINITY_DN2881_c0_g1_i1.p1  ORF type:complete len:502 (+),score=78.69 TRINITY_DN2881_c0_g1_i1:321-1826(+)